MTAPTPTPSPTFTQQILGATAPNTAAGSAASSSTGGNWQALVVFASGVLAALFMLTPRRKRKYE